jgi:hypothetical protein
MTAPEVQGFAIFPDGSHLFLWKDFDRTIRELEKISPADANGFVEFGLRLRRFGQIMRPFIFCTTPPRRSEVMAAFDQAGEAELYNEFVLGSVRSLLEKYFVSEHIKGFPHTLWPGFHLGRPGYARRSLSIRLSRNRRVREDDRPLGLRQRRDGRHNSGARPCGNSAWGPTSAPPLRSARS